MTDPEASQLYKADPVATARAGEPVGQSFIARRPGLNGIQLWLQPDPGGGSQSGTLEAALYTAAADSPVYTTTVAIPQAANSRPFTLAIPPQAGPHGQWYYLELRAMDGSVQALGRSEDAYPDGEAYASGLPLDADLSFQLTYDWGQAALAEDLGRAGRALPLAIPLALVLWLPGRVCLLLLGLDRDRDWGARTAMSAGFSLAILPILMTWTSLAGLPWSRTGVWAAMALLAGVYGWRVLRPGRFGPRVSEPTREAEPSMGVVAKTSVHIPDIGEFLGRKTAAQPGLASGIALLAIFLFSLAVRLVMARDLAAPPWVDSVHHAMVAALIQENGVYPTSYAPFVDIETASYHPGFHTGLAAFSWLSGLELIDALLDYGQALNALAAVFGVYLFTISLTRDRLAGLFAALIAGVFTPMPAYYTSWGRYTQLAGMLILPSAAALTLEILSGQARRIRTIAGAAALMAGLFLTHYRVAAFAVLLVAAGIPALLWGAIRQQYPGRAAWGRLGQLAAAGGLAILLTLPWWPPMVTTLLLPRLGYRPGGEPFNDFSWAYLNTAYGRQALALAGLGALSGLGQRRGFPFLLALWIALMFGLANLHVLNLPGAGLVNNTSVAILLYLPAAALGGYFLSQLVRTLEQPLPARARTAYRLLVAAAAAGLALAGARTLLPLLNTATVLFRQADRPAMQWINEHVPAGETVLINPFNWGYGLYAGQDGGYWIVPSAGRPTLPPPVLAGFDNDPARMQQTTDFIRQALDAAGQPQALAALLEARGIDYVYLGARGGVFSPARLMESGLFRPVYASQGTWVFQRNFP